MTRTPGSSQSVIGGFSGELAKAADQSISSQTPTTTEDAAAGAGSTTPLQAVATVSADAVQTVATVTADAGQSAGTTLAPTGNNGAAPTVPAPSSGNATPNSPPVGPSNPATYASNNTSPNEAGVGPSTVDRARFVQRVARAFQAVGDQGGEIRLRLSPPDLGSLQMQISVKDGGITAHIQADNSTAQQLLLQSLPDLRDRLAQQDIHIERFDVQVAGQSSGGMPQSPQGNPDFDQTNRRPMAASNAPAASQATDTAQTASSVITVTSGALNVVV